MNLKRAFRGLGLAAVLCMAPFASADTLQYVGGAVSPGYGPGVGPYNIMINGTAVVQGICDDFVHTIPGGPWTAIRNSFADLSGARFIGQGIQKYFQVAWLSERLLAATTTAQRAILQYAIWDTFNNVGSIGIRSDVDTMKAQAVAATANAVASDFADWSVYTPAGSPNSQEFLVRTPETSAALLLLFNLSALVGVVFLLRRRIAQV